jgi:cell division protein FtsB
MSRLTTLVVLSIGLIFVISLVRSIFDFLKAEDRIQDEELKLAQLQLKNEELKKKLAEVESSEYLEKAAREKLGLAKEGEVVVILPSVTPLPEAKGQSEENLPNWQKWLKVFF